MWVKICANTNLEDALLAVELGADAVGFVFAPSKRRVTVEQVAEITAALPEGVEKVGVFTSTDAMEIVDAAEGAGLTVVQLHSALIRRWWRRLMRAAGTLLQVLQVVDVPEEMDRGGVARGAARGAGIRMWWRRCWMRRMGARRAGRGRRSIGSGRRRWCARSQKERAGG